MGGDGSETGREWLAMDIKSQGMGAISVPVQASTMDTQTYTPVILYLSHSIHYIGQTITEAYYAQISWGKVHT